VARRHICGIARDRAFAVDDLARSVRGTSIRRANTVGVTPSSERSSFKTAPGGAACGNIEFVPSLVVVAGCLDIDRTRRATRPFKTDSPLHIDANAVLAPTVAAERFKSVAAQSPKITDRSRRNQYRQPASGLLGESSVCLDEIATGEAFGFPVATPDNHPMSAWQH
jgi:hypothetical protein